MFKTFMLLFRKKFLEGIVTKIYDVISTLLRFLNFVLENHEQEVVADDVEAIAGVSVLKIKRMVRILELASSVMETSAKYLLGLNLSILANERDPIDDESLKNLEESLDMQLNDLRAIEK